MLGYWKRPEATAETLRDGWLHTGDLGRMDEHGYLYLLDRAKDLIISGGSNVYAVEVEAVLADHAAVRDVAVVGLPDRTWGEVVAAVVVANPDSDPTTLGGVLDHTALGDSRATSVPAATCSSTRCRATPTARSSNASSATSTTPDPVQRLMLSAEHRAGGARSRCHAGSA